jgi:hypothetical protein
MTFSLWGLTGFEMQYWNGSAWATVPGGSVSGNNKVWRKITFSPITTTKIRVLTNAGVDGYSRIVELEAWGWPASSNATAQIHWLVTDHLGTPRIILDQSGNFFYSEGKIVLLFGSVLALNNPYSGIRFKERTKMPGPDLSYVAVGLVAVASLVSLLLLILKGLGKEFESVALLWIRVWRRISEERKK